MKWSARLFEENGVSDDDSNDDEEEDGMKHNVFDKENAAAKCISHSDEEAIISFS